MKTLIAPILIFATSLSALAAQAPSGTAAESCVNRTYSPIACPSGENHEICYDHIWSQVPRCIEPQDNSRGFCVDAGIELIRQNAVVKVVDSEIDGRKLFPTNHGFFEPSMSTAELKAGNRGGDVTFTKIIVNEDGSFLATFEDHTHGFNVPLKNVTCRAAATL